MAEFKGNGEKTMMKADDIVSGVTGSAGHPLTVRVSSPRAGIRRSVAAGLFTGVIASAVVVPATHAATRDEVIHLNAAYPSGSVMVCSKNLPGDGKMIQPTILQMRGTVVDRKQDSAVYEVSSTWSIPGKSSSSDLTLKLRMLERMDDKGSYSSIVPDSMSVSMTSVGPAGEKSVLEGFRRRLPAGEIFTPFSNIEITDFPSYTVQTRGEPTSYCHRESAGS
ncbi:MAG: hypothetical protein LBE90_15250 [Pantoea dispersa]|jgi:hypothetical protein|nr:hypothetical protein [Pantoea dispersa]MBZ6391844.1 hypothetical protein [Pantoea dispersa]